MNKEIVEKSLAIDNNSLIPELFGKFDENIKVIEKEYNVEILLREGQLKIIGEKISVDLTEKLLFKLVEMLKKQGKISNQELSYAMQLVYEGNEDKIQELLDDIICVTAQGKSIRPKTLGQKKYIDSIRKNDIVFGIGPAGTGKTYLAMATAAFGSDKSASHPSRHSEMCSTSGSSSAHAV